MLKSLSNGDIYVGSSNDIKNRLKLHNTGKVRSTKAYRPWGLIGSEAFQTRSEAFKREHFLKTGQQKEILGRRYGLVAKW
ncbi:MAG TPA: GIY-YIG nuclease family protein [Candidatus Paceibacterota bacterium]